MSLDTQKPVEAKRMGNSLVAAFHRANPPLVWRLDLERNHSFSLALQGEDGDWELGLTSPKGDFQPIARFALREDAEEAFVKVEKILSRAQIPWFKVSLKILGVIALFLIVGFLVMSLVFGRGGLRMASRAGASAIDQIQPANGIPAAPVEMKSGIPVPADEVLRPPE